VKRGRRRRDPADHFRSMDVKTCSETFELVLGNTAQDTFFVENAKAGAVAC
jgi:hypothetical protein